MTPRLTPLLLALPLLGAFAGAAMGGGSPLHPGVLLLDEDGNEVLETGKPISPLETCGTCHDTAYIAGHSYHASVGADETFEPGSRPGVPPWNFSPGMFGRWDPMRYRRMTIPGESSFDLGLAEWIQVFGDRHAGGGPAGRDRAGAPLEERVPGADVDPETHVLDPETGKPVPWDWQISGAVEMNCFLCHVPSPDDAARIESLRAGRFRWAATATLGHTGLVEKSEDGTYRYRAEAFEEGLAPQATLRIADPRSENCGLCHGQVHTGPDPVALKLGPKEWETDTKGQIWSPQSVSDSALNLHDKSRRTHPWDVHASRLLQCTDCHRSINNPLAFAEATRSRPKHLKYDARRLQFGDYLKTPSHHFAKGESAQGTVARRLDGSMRRCEDCHNATESHEAWLPNPRRHLTVMLCETCHIPEVAAPAHQQCDWTVLTPEEEPRVAYRGVVGDVDDPRSLVTGYEPVVLPRHQKNGRIRHGPHNLCTGWYWVGGEPVRPVPRSILRKAWFQEDGAYRADILRALDENGDGRLVEGELRLDTGSKVAVVSSRLETLGVKNPRIEGVVQPMSLHHAVVPGRFATKTCESCHARESRLTRPYLLSSYVPAGATARLAGDTNIEMPGRLYRDDDGRLLYEPVPTASGRYVIGYDRAGWIDVVGLFLVLGTVIGVAVHATLRWRHGRKRANGEVVE